MRVRWFVYGVNPFTAEAIGRMIGASHEGDDRILLNQKVSCGGQEYTYLNLYEVNAEQRNEILHALKINSRFKVLVFKQEGNGIIRHTPSKFVAGKPSYQGTDWEENFSFGEPKEPKDEYDRV